MRLFFRDRLVFLSIFLLVLPFGVLTLSADVGAHWPRICVLTAIFEPAFVLILFNVCHLFELPFFAPCAVTPFYEVQVSSSSKVSVVCCAFH